MGETANCWYYNIGDERLKAVALCDSRLGAGKGGVSASCIIPLIYVVLKFNKPLPSLPEGRNRTRPRLA
jgi:hypothetical protein